MFYIPDPCEPPLLVGDSSGNIESYGIIGARLSTELLAVPLHSLDASGQRNFKKIHLEESVDLAIVSTPIEAVTKILRPLHFQFKIPSEGLTFVFSVEGNIVTNCTPIPNEPMLYYLEFKTNLQSNNSGVVVSGTAELSSLYSSPHIEAKTKVSCSLFFMLARDKVNHKRGLALYLPEVLKYITNREFESKTIISPSFPITDFLLITTPGEVKRRASMLTFEKRLQFLERRLNSDENANHSDKAVIKYIVNHLKNEFGEVNQHYLTLFNAFCQSKPNGPNEDRCWVVDYEKFNHCSVNGFFQKIGELMQTIGVTNAYINREQNVYELFSGSFEPISVDQKTFYSLTKSSSDMFIVHNPQLCGRNPDGRGNQTLQPKKCVDVFLPRCCIKPSHMMCLNRNYTDMSTVIEETKYNYTDNILINNSELRDINTELFW